MPDSVNLTFVLAESDSVRIRSIAEAGGTYDGPDHGRHLDRTQLLELVRLPAAERQEIVDWVASHGMTVVDASGNSPQLMFVQATREQVRRAFGRELITWLEKDPDNAGARMQLALPRRLAGYVIKVGGVTGEQGQMGMLISGLAGVEATPGTRVGASTARGVGGVGPADIRQIYSFPDEWDGRGETIAMLVLGGRVDPTDLHRFWRAHGIPPPEIHTVQVGPAGDHPPHPLHTLEAAMCVEWTGAMAPGARIVLYFVDPTVMGDPWAAFLFAVVGDDHFRPGVAVTSWVTPERQYYRLHGHRVITGLLDQAAALGITVISAAGDWGPYDGVPRVVCDGRHVVDAPWPHGVFPAVEERVLAVGGTMITCRDPLTEVAWSGPPPPGIRKAMHCELLAGSGGFSYEVPVPQWQRPVLRPYYPRGAGTPAVVPYGRGYPDVALMAAGPGVQRHPGDALTSQAGQAVVAGEWIDFAGGTSLAAAIWAAIIARANEARRHAGLGRVGFVNPLLYSVARMDSTAFREITAGTSDVAMNAVNVQGKAVPYRLAGFECRAGWDPVCGLGVPHVRNLIARLCSTAAPMSCPVGQARP